jgi:hypothetical protein
VEIRGKSVKFASLLSSLVKSGGMSQEELERVRELAEGNSSVSSDGMIAVVGRLVL